MADDDLKRRRASAFGAVAAEYAEHRPNYAEAAIRWALAPVTGGSAAGDGSGSASAGRAGGSVLAGLPVLDLGAGTGKLTAQLAALGAAVTAVEPDASMLAELRRTLPSVPALAGNAESIPLPDGSVRAVLCGQSMHWFDLERALPELARVLAPGGVLAGLWNGDDDRVEWVAGLHAVANVSADGAVGRTRSTERSDASAVSFIERSPEFSSAEAAEFPHGQRRTAESLVATFATHSLFLVMTPPEQEQVAGRLRTYLRSRPETAAGEFTLPMLTFVLRTIRKG